MKYLLSAYLFMICCCIYHSVKAKSKDSSNSAISKNNSNEKYKNHNMDGWTPIKPTLEYLKLNQRKNCVSIGFFNADCKPVTEKSTTTTKYKSIVDLFQRDYHSPYGNFVAELLPKLPNHYKNPLPKYRQNNRREFRRFSTNIKRNFELPRFIAEYPTNEFLSRPFEELVSKYWKWQKYPMLEPTPGQILYPPSVPQFKSNPLNVISQQHSRKDDDVAFRQDNKNIKTFQPTIFPFYEHESITKRTSTNKPNVRDKLDTTSPVVSMVIEPTTITVSSTTSGVKANTKHSTIKPSVHYVYSVPVYQTTNYVSSDFEKELPRKVVAEPAPKRSLGDNHFNIGGNGMISTKLISNRFLEYTTSGYSNYVTIKPFIDRPDGDTTQSIEDMNEIPKNKNRMKTIPLLHFEEVDTDEELSSVENTLKSSIIYGYPNRTYTANNAGFKSINSHKSTKKTTLKPLIYTLSSLLLDTDDQSASHQLPKSGQYVDHLSSAIINDHVGKTQRTEQPAEAILSSITIKHQPPLPNKSNNQNTTNSRWTQLHELYAINNNDGINDRDQKIKDINLDIVITADGPTTNRNQIYENKNYSGINDGDEWNDGNGAYGKSRALNAYGRVNVEPNLEWIMVAKSSFKDAKFSDRIENSRSKRLMSSSYRDSIVPMTRMEMPKVNNSNITLGTKFLVQ